MRLFELITTNYKTIDTEFDKNALKDPEDYPDDDKSVGATGKVDSHDDNFLVKKTYHRPTKELKNDPYYVYIKTIADNNLSASNPFFPRVYDIEIETDNQGNQRPKFDIEKLIPCSDLDDDVIYHLGENLINDFGSINIKPVWPAKKLSRILHLSIEDNDYEHIKNTKLKQALQLIHNVMKSNTDFVADLHFNNIMFRGTPSGPQLVLTDPIA